MRPDLRQLWYQVPPALRRWGTWGTLGLLGLLLLLLIERGPILDLVYRRMAVRAWVLGFGAMAPLAYIALFVAQILIAPLPGHFMGLMGGYLFGTLEGSLYSLVGLGVGAGLAASIARHVGRPVIRRLVGQEELRRWERQLRVRSPITWWLIFLFPVPDATYYLAGLSGVPLRWLLLVVLAGRGPGLVAGNWLGHQAVTLPPQLALVPLAIFVVTVFIVYRYQRWLRLAMLLAQRRASRLDRRLRAHVAQYLRRSGRLEGLSQKSQANSDKNGITADAG